MTEIKYQRGAYNKFNDKEQWIRISDGCSNGCAFCYAPKDFECYEVPEIVRNKVKLMDMNFLQHPSCLEIIKELSSKRVKGKVVYYELICGIDWRVLDQEFADLLHLSRFKNIRLAWDYTFSQQKKIKKAVDMLLRAGYKQRDITIFMICNWKIPYTDCLRKLDLCKIWRVKVADCYFDNQTSPNIKPIHWDIDQIKDFRKRVRKHNQMVNFGIDPEI